MNKKIKSLMLIAMLTVSLGALAGCSKDTDTSNTGYKDIKGEETVKLMDDTDDLLILDVRDENEYEAGHIEDAVHVSVDDVEKRMSEFEDYKDKTVLVYCRVGKRSAKASETLSKNGFENVYNAEDGVEEYEYKLVK